MSYTMRRNGLAPSTTALLWIVCWLSIAGCRSPLPETLPGFDTSRCDPAVRTDCISVSGGFVDRRLELEDKVIRLQLDLKSCRRALERP